MRTILLNGEPFEIPATTDEWELDDPAGLAANELTAALCSLIMEVAQRLQEGYSINRTGTLTLYDRFMQKAVDRYVDPDHTDPRAVALFYIDMAVARLT